MRKLLKKYPKDYFNEKPQLLSDIELAESQIANGQGMSHDQVKSQILNRLVQ